MVLDGHPNQMTMPKSLKGRKNHVCNNNEKLSKAKTRGNVMSASRLSPYLKGTRFTIMEDLTALNSKTLSRVSKDPAVATAWTWNGKILAMLKTGEKITVRPFQSLAC